MIARATALRGTLRDAQAECEAQGRVSENVNGELIRAGFYRVIQPRCFGGYEFDAPTFCRVMMEIARGCPETGWVLALTAGHPLIIANFPLEGQREVYGKNGEFRCPAAFNPHGATMPVAGGYRLTASWPSASGCDTGTHHLGSATVTGADGKPTAHVIQVLLTREQYRIVDDWHVMGMQGTGSKRIVAEDVFVPVQRTVAAVGVGRGNEPAQRTGLHANPLYLGRTASFLIAGLPSIFIAAASSSIGSTLVARLPPTASRSFISVTSDTCHPLPTGPSRWLSGTRTLVKNTSLKARSPLICLIGRISMPGLFMSMKNIVSPLCFGTFGSVRVTMMPKSE